MDEVIATLTFTMTVGRMVAGQVEREVRRAAHEAGVSIAIERHMGWLEGVLLVTATGRSSYIQRYADAIEGWKP